MSKKKPSLVIEDITASKEIALIQLERLKALSRDRLLSYEELKMYDILTKNLMLINGDPTAIISSAKHEEQKALEDAQTSDLIEIATAIDEEKVKKVLNFVEEAKDGDSKDTDN